MRRQESFPWIIVMGGAVLYWTIALGIGIPSLYRLLGPPGPAHRGAAVEARCVQSMSVDGKTVEFGECFNVRFVPDLPEMRGDFSLQVPHRVGAPEATSPDHEIETPTWNPTGVEQEPQPDRSDSFGRTAY